MTSCRSNSNFSTFAAGKKSRWRGAVVSKVNLINHEFSKQYSYVNLIFNFQLLVKSVEKNKAVWAINARQISQKMIHWYYFWSEMSKKIKILNCDFVFKRFWHLLTSSESARNEVKRSIYWYWRKKSEQNIIVIRNSLRHCLHLKNE